MVQIKWVLNILVIFFFVLASFCFVMCIAGGGILNDLDMALIEIEAIEIKGLLDNPPFGTSRIALREIRLLGNTYGLKDYIKETEENLVFMGKIFYLVTLLFVLLIFTRGFIGIKMRKALNPRLAINKNIR